MQKYKRGFLTILLQKQYDATNKKNKNRAKEVARFFCDICCPAAIAFNNKLNK